MKTNIIRRFAHILIALIAWLALAPSSLAATIRYVDLNSHHATPPFTNWAKAATNIQDAVDVALPGDSILVTNGTYQTSGRTVPAVEELNSLAVTKALTVRSVGGPAFTAISGAVSMRCVYLTNGAVLSGFTLSVGRVRGNGAGAYGGTLTNCILTGNYAGYASLTSSLGPGGQGGAACNATLNNCTLTSNTVDGRGGGAAGCTLNNCVLSSNSAPLIVVRFPYEVFYGSGGAAFDCTLNNCTLTSNSSSWAGGTRQCALTNCIVYGNWNSANNNPVDNYDSCSFSHCCTTPLPSGDGNISAAPLFVNSAAGNLRLQSNSPCINAGSNAGAPLGLDLGGNQRVSGFTVDIGAYEFQNPSSVISYAWLQQYGFPMDGSADFADTDADGMNNWQEWRAGTSPLDAASLLTVLGVSPGADGVTITWQSVPNRTYFVQRRATFAPTSPFTTLATGIPGQTDATGYVDTSASGSGPFFYRVGVE